MIENKNQIIAEVHSLTHDGRGIATINGITTFIEGALPHEKVSCKIFKKSRNYQEAKVEEILQASPERTTPPCQYFGVCGGCSLQHASNSLQIEYKQQTLLSQLKQFGKVIPTEILPPLTGKTSGYRRRARLGVRYVKKKERILVGFREKNSRYLADLGSCYVLDPVIGTRFKELSAVITSLSQREHIPQIEVSIGDNENALVFRCMTELEQEDKQKLIDFARQYSFSIYIQPNSPQTIYKLYPQETSELMTYSLPDYQLEIYFHPTDFIQINPEMNQRLIKQALTLLSLRPEDSLLDLYCGLGNFTLPLARTVKDVVGVEGAKEMVERAKSNAEKNKISNVEFYTANLMEPDPQAPWLLKKYDKILLDPPRTGAKEIIPYITRLSAKQIVYVSCNPSTFARDAGELANHGYQLTKTGIVNMFPHTSHIEAIGLFEADHG